MSSRHIRRFKRYGFIALTTMGAAYLFAALLLVADGLTDEIGNADVALVLGNKVEPDGTPSPRLAARLDRAAELFNEKRFQWIMVSGGTGKEGYPEGDAMRDYLITHGVPTSAIVVDNLGSNTQASAENTVALLNARQWNSAFVITQHFHVPRSKLALKKLGVEEVFSAHAQYFELRDLYSVAREVPAYVKYLLK